MIRRVRGPRRRHSQGRGPRKPTPPTVIANQCRNACGWLRAANNPGRVTSRVIIPENMNSGPSPEPGGFTFQETGRNFNRRVPAASLGGKKRPAGQTRSGDPVSWTARGSVSSAETPVPPPRRGGGLFYGLLTLGNATPPTGLFLYPPYRKPSVTVSRSAGRRDVNGAADAFFLGPGPRSVR